MPKETFFKLSTDKQHLLIKAAKEEFSRAPFHEACISNIVQSAHIPRGSFYQYFEDKEDLYLFLLNQYSKKTNQKFISILENQNGHLFDSFITFFKYLLENTEQQTDRNFFKNTFLNLNYKTEHTLINNLDAEEHKILYSNVVEKINTEELNIHNEQELYHVIKIIKALLFQNLVQHFAKQITNEKSLEEFSIEIQLLKRGFYKKKKDD